MIYAVIDTNVLVAAKLTHHDDAATLRVIRAVFFKKVTPLISPAIIAEYRDVLARPKFGFSPEEVTDLIELFLANGKQMNSLHYDGEMVDEKDRVFYEIALAGESMGAKLVTGNAKHYPISPIVVSPAEFCVIINI